MSLRTNVAPAVRRAPRTRRRARWSTACSRSSVLDGSSFVLIITALTGFATVAMFAWAWWTGKLEELESQALGVFDPRDLRLARPWESADDRAARARDFGELVDPVPGEWGDARRP